MLRRDVLGSIGAALVAGALPAGAMAAAAKTAARRWGVQLFTVIALMEQDFEGTLKAIAQIGYKEVETVGSFGRPPAQVRALLDRYGLVSPSQHIASDEIYGSFSAWTARRITTEQNRANYVAGFRLEKSIPLVEGAIRQAHVLGQKYVVWPILMPEQLATREILDGYLRVFNVAGEMCRKEGLTFSFHNHAREFAKLGDDVIYDLILAGTDAETVKMEMDFYWITKAGADPLGYLAHNPGRYRMVHVKDMATDGDFAVAGKGVIDIGGLIARARAAGVEHFFVEYDRSSDPLREVRESFAYLRALG